MNNKHFEIGTIIVRDSDGKKVRKPIPRPGTYHTEDGYKRNIKHKGKQDYDN